MTPYLKLVWFCVISLIVAVAFVIGGIANGSPRGILVAILGGVALISLAVLVGAGAYRQRGMKRR